MSSQGRPRKDRPEAGASRRRLALATGGGVLLAAALIAAHWLGAEGPASPAPAPPAQAGTRASLASGQSLGMEAAPVTVEVFSDFQCPYCRIAALEVVPRLEADFVASGRARLVFRNFPFLGPESVQAAAAAACAAEQNLFWPYHDALFAAQGRENAGTITPERLLQLADRAGAGRADFESCLASERPLQRIQEDFARGQSLGVQATPTFVVNGQVFRGLVPYDQLEQAIRRSLGGPRR